MTLSLSDLRWEHAKGQIRKQPDISASAAFGGDNDCYRYIAQYVWDASKTALVAVMANPSTATHLTLDPTVAGMVRRAREWGHGGLIVANAFAFRATDPNVMYAQDEPVGPLNDLVLASLFARIAADKAFGLVGWGKIGAHRNRSAEVIAMARAVNAPLHALKINLDGSPSHPLYIGMDKKPVPWPPRGVPVFRQRKRLL